MANSFDVNTHGAEEKIKAIRLALSDKVGKVLEEALTDARAEIIARTESGRDVEGNQFKPYSDKYELAKRRKLGGPSIPNLTLGVKFLSLKRNKNKPGKGSRAPPGMLRSIKVKVTKIAGGFLGKIYVNPAQEGKVRGNQKIRKFFDLSKEQYTTIERKIAEAINGRR